MSEDKNIDKKWLLEKTIPYNAITHFQGQSGVGKSLFGESLVSSTVKDKKTFIGRKLNSGSVLLIDQDTSEEALKIRLKKMGVNDNDKYNLYLHSMEGLSLPDCVSIINEYDDIILALIDSLHSVSLGLNVNDTRDMSILFEFKRKVLREGLAVCIVHHISEKIGLNYNEIMTTLDTGKLVMGNSTIYQCADNIIIITSPDRGKFMKTQYIRPIAKRFLIDTDPFVIELHEDKENMWYEYVGKYEEKDKCIEAILIFLKSDGNWRDFMEIYQGLDREYGQVKLREKLAYLSDKNIIVRKLEKPNIFKYIYPSKKRSVKHN